MIKNVMSSISITIMKIFHMIDETKKKILLYPAVWISSFI